MRWWNTKQEPSGPIGPTPRKIPEPCAVDGCVRKASNGVHCEPHYRRIMRNGDPGPAEIQKKAGNGQGHRRYMNNGYWWVRRPEHPNAYSTGCLQEHTVVMSEMLGRPLVTGENVHHINGVRTDNRPANLELWVTKQPKGQRVPDLLEWAHEIIGRYSDT